MAMVSSIFEFNSRTILVTNSIQEDRILCQAIYLAKHQLAHCSDKFGPGVIQNYRHIEFFFEIVELSCHLN